MRDNISQNPYDSVEKFSFYARTHSSVSSRPNRENVAQNRENLLRSMRRSPVHAQTAFPPPLKISDSARNDSYYPWEKPAPFASALVTRRCFTALKNCFERGKTAS